MTRNESLPEAVGDLVHGPKVSQFLESYRWDKPLLVYGEPGVGKSAIARVLACERGWELVDVIGDNLREVASSSQAASLFGGRKLLLVDDAERIRDKGALASLLKASRNPVVLTTSDAGSPKLKSVKSLCNTLQVRKPLPTQIRRLLAERAKARGVVVEEGVLDAIARGCHGNLSCALIDLDTLMAGRKTVTAREAEVLAPRDRGIDVYKALSTIFGAKDPGQAMQATWDLDERPDAVIQWVSENVPLVYPPEDVPAAYGALSRADVYLGRIRRRQYWGLLRYANSLMTAGVAAAKTGKLRFQRYRFPSLFSKLSRAKAQRALSRGVAWKLSPVLHASTRVVEREFIPLYRTLIDRGAMSQEDVAEAYRLDADEAAFLAR